MKKLLIIVLLFATPAMAQTSQAQVNIINEWISMIVTLRVNKNWTPKLYASPATASELGTVAEIVVTPDPSLKDRVLQLRNLEAFQDGKTLVPANEIIAERKW